MKKLIIILLVAGVALAAAPIKAVKSDTVIKAKACTEWQAVNQTDPNSSVYRYCETTNVFGCSTTQETASCAYGCPVTVTYIGNHCVGLP